MRRLVLFFSKMELAHLGSKRVRECVNTKARRRKGTKKDRLEEIGRLGFCTGRFERLPYKTPVLPVVADSVNALDVMKNRGVIVPG